MREAGNTGVASRPSKRFRCVHSGGYSAVLLQMEAWPQCIKPDSRPRAMQDSAGLAATSRHLLCVTSEGTLTISFAGSWCHRGGLFIPQKPKAFRKEKNIEVVCVSFGNRAS